MDEAKFRDYEQNRYGGELHGCEKWGFRNDWAYKLFQLSVILFSALVSAAIALEQLIPNFPGRLSALIASLRVNTVSLLGCVSALAQKF